MASVFNPTGLGHRAVSSRCRSFHICLAGTSPRLPSQCTWESRGTLKTMNPTSHPTQYTSYTSVHSIFHTIHILHTRVHPMSYTIHILHTCVLHIPQCTNPTHVCTQYLIPHTCAPHVLNYTHPTHKRNTHVYPLYPINTHPTTHTCTFNAESFLISIHIPFPPTRRRL